MLVFQSTLLRELSLFVMKKHFWWKEVCVGAGYVSENPVQYTTAMRSTALFGLMHHMSQRTQQ